MALPLAYLAARRGSLRLLFGATIVAGLVWLGAGSVDAVLVFVLITSLGLTIAIGIRRSWSFRRMLLVGGSAATAALCVWGGSTWFLLGLDVARVRSSVGSSIDSVSSAYTKAGLSPELNQSVTSQLRHVMHFVPYLLPGLVVMASLLLAACAIGLAHRLFPKTDETGMRQLSLSRLRFHWALAYLAIVGLALLLFPRGSGGVQTAVRLVGGNALLISQTLFFFQGLAVVQWYAVHRRLPRRQRRWLYFGALVAQAVLQLTGIFGLFDTWLDYRRRIALKSPKPGQTN
jgi:uncharacterized protein YybS (DUF2232 family)